MPNAQKVEEKKVAVSLAPISALTGDVPRQDELSDASNDLHWSRSERVFKVKTQWYFHTREGMDVGPFATCFEAQVEASLLKEKLKTFSCLNARKTAICQYVNELRSEGKSVEQHVGQPLDMMIPA